VKINRYFSTVKKIFLWVKNPEKMFTDVHHGVLGAVVQTNLVENWRFLRIDIEKVK